MNRTRILIAASIVLILCLAGLIFYEVQSLVLPMPQADVTASTAAVNTHAAGDGAALIDQPSVTPFASATIVVANASPASVPAATTVVHPTHIYPANTPTPQTLSEFAQASNGIAEVEVTYADEGGAIVKVERWLKVITLFAEKPPMYTVNLPFVNVGLASNGPQLLHAGGRYILLIQGQGAEVWCHPTGYSVTYGTKGVYEIKGDKIGYSGIPGYSGMPVAQFEALLQQQVPASEQVQPTVVPDMGKYDLTQIVHSSDLILEATQTGGQGSTGGVFLNYTISKILKKPSFVTVPVAVPGGVLTLRYMNCSNISVGSPGHLTFILFVAGYEELGHLGHPVSGQGFFSINSDNIVTFGGFTHPTGQIWTYDSLNYYAGWPLSKAEAAISNAMQVPYTPQPTPTSAQH
jgi:hypothetical protein